MNQKLIIIGIIAIVVIIGIVLGVVFGTRGGSNDSSKSNESPPLPTAAPVPMIPTTAAPTTTPTSALLGVIKSAALQGGDEFLDTNSYQYKALLYMQDIDAASDTAFTDEQLIQRYALACIFISTNKVEHFFTQQELGDTPLPEWSNTQNWMTAASECEWFGITCDNFGFIVGMDLDENNLSGSIPNEITLLQRSLNNLNLVSNFIYNEGDEGLAWIGELTNMRDLFLGSTYLVYDGIPPVFAKLNATLRRLDISYTIFHGDMRAAETLAPLTSLTYLEMGGNTYNASIPVELASLPMLDSLYIDDASITGDLSFLSSMDLIFELWLDANDITGQIPTTIDGQPTLTSISWTSNKLTGPIPTEMGNLVNMTQIWLYSNQLTGAVPSELGALTMLELMQVDFNNLEGVMPAEVCDLTPIFGGGRLSTLGSDCGDADTAVLAEVECSCCTCCIDCS